MHFAARRPHQRDRRREVPDLHVVIDAAVEDACRHIGEVQRRTAQTANLEVREHAARHGYQLFVAGTVKTNQRFPREGCALHAGHACSVLESESRTTVNEHPATQIVDDPINGLPVFAEGQRNRAVRKSQREIVCAVDRVEHP